MKKTHHCNQLKVDDCSTTVTLVGWIDSIRNHGVLIFIDLRDCEGLTQIVFDSQNPDFHKETFKILKEESVIEVTGIVSLRPYETRNSKISTGAIEITAQILVIHNIAGTLPFQIYDKNINGISDTLRLKYRYLDLRRPKMRNLLRIRHNTSHTVREYLNDRRFLEVEMPILLKSTPEGAREFLVPSRLHPGTFYALSQSPQQYKQMLMVAGIERYYSLARCFRDEDLRSDRQPEFTQIDLEESFIDREDIYSLTEGMLTRIWKDVLNIDIVTPFPRISYQDAINHYGTDKPDTRYGLEISDLTQVFIGSNLKVFNDVIQRKGVIKALNVKGLDDISQGEMKTLEGISKDAGAKGLAYIKVRDGQWHSPLARFLSDFEKCELSLRLDIKEGDTIFFAAAENDCACIILGRIRIAVAELLKTRGRLNIKSNQYNFIWVVDFPLVLRDPESGRYVATHHPFTAPVPEDIVLLESSPERMRGQHYDIVLNGVELGGGSIRVHQSDIQRKIFKDILGFDDDFIEDHFGYMLEAFKYGAPPHGGIAIGLDRLVAILGNQESIREVIAFPKTKSGQDVMSSAPGLVNPAQLDDMSIAILPTISKLRPL